MGGRLTSPRFVGRERELATIASLLGAVADGRPRTLILSGPAGIGVSRLIDESERRLGTLDMPFAVGRGRAWEGDPMPYGPVVDALEPLLAAVADADLAALLGPAAEPISRLIPRLGARLRRLGIDLGRPPIVARERRQARLLESVLGVLERLARRRPVLFVLEDLHAADAGTRSVAEFIARVTRPSRICLVATYQSDVVARDHPLRADLASMLVAARRPDVLALDRMTDAALAEIVEAIEGERPGGSLLLLVTERSHGSPLIVEELIAARHELSGVLPIGSLDELVAARLAERSPECRRVLRILARAGAPLTASELAATAAAHDELAAGLPPRSTTAPRRGEGALDADLAAGLEEAIDRGFVTLNGPVHDSPTPEVRLPLRHDLLARAISADLLPAQRRRLDTALGIALVDRPAARLARLVAAHELSVAQSAALEVAELARDLDAPRDELAALELAIELSSDDGSRTGSPTATAQRDAARLLATTAEAAFAADQAGRAAAYTEAAIARFEERSDALELGLLYERLGRFRWVLGDSAGSLAAHKRAVSLVHARPTVERARVLAGLAQALMLDGRFHESERIALGAIKVARAAGRQALPEEGHALCSLGIGLAWSGRADEAPVLLERAQAIAEDTDRTEDLFRALANRSTALDLLGRRTEAIRVAREGIERARSVGLEAVYGNFIRGNVANIMFLEGRWAEAAETCRTALEWSAAGPAVQDAEISLATVLTESAADDEAARQLGRALLALETHPDPQFVGPASRAAASFALWRGDPADAVRSAEIGWSRATEAEDWVLMVEMAVTLIAALAAVGDEARESSHLGRLASARARSKEVLHAARSAVARAAVGREIGSRRRAEANLATAEAYASRLDGRDDPATWSLVAAAWEAAGDRYQVGRAQWRQAEAALRANDSRTGRRLARGPLLAAVEVAQTLGARPLLRECVALAERARITLPQDETATGATSTVVAIGITADGSSDGLVTAFAGTERTSRSSGDVFGLSHREREVLGLITQGKTNREIGDRLFISQKTVGVHVGNVLSKMKVAGRVEAATVAIRLGLVDR
ncbi:MAG TPA: AAA family ATPase [Candidatus Limnocylindrales bacterium]